VADSILRKWFGSSPATEAAVTEARADLDRVAAVRPSFQPVLRWLHDILPDLATTPSSVPTLSLEPEHAHAKLTSGIPLLRGETFAVDPQIFRRRWQRLCEALEAQQADGAASAHAEAVRSGRMNPAEMVAAVVGGRPEVIRQRADEQGLDPSLATTLVRFTLFPLLTATEAELGPLRDGTAWEQGYCPTCGSWPLVGEFRGLEQTRFLRCGLCAAEWEVPRLWCPYCGNRDHEALSSLHTEGEEAKYRAAVCDGCRGYVKMISTLSALPPLALLVQDAATLHLDLAAAERGYASHCS
jgi:FdhE protein